MANLKDIGNHAVGAGASMGSASADMASGAFRATKSVVRGAGSLITTPVDVALRTIEKFPKTSVVTGLATAAIMAERAHHRHQHENEAVLHPDIIQNQLILNENQERINAATQAPATVISEPASVSPMVASHAPGISH